MRTLFAFFAILLASWGGPAAAEPITNGTITISISEYEKLTKAEEAKKKDQYWNMTFEQILDKEGNNYTRAWEKYEFWVLRRVHLKGVVNDSSVDTLANQIETLNRIGMVKPLTIVIDSPGGGVLAGFRLLNAMNNSTVPVNTVCDGWAMSMAAVVLAYGSHREVNKGCVFMIHEVGTGAPGGQTTDHIKWAETVINVENILASILAESSGLSVKDVRAVWEYETFFNAEETVRLGFADEIIPTGNPSQVPGSRTVPEDLLPLNKMRKSFDERLTK